MANEPEDKGQFGDGGTRRISKETVEKAKEKPTETTKKDDKK
jgi:hypothetical protein